MMAALVPMPYCLRDQHLLMAHYVMHMLLEGHRVTLDCAEVRAHTGYGYMLQCQYRAW